MFALFVMGCFFHAKGKPQKCAQLLILNSQWAVKITLDLGVVVATELLLLVRATHVAAAPGYVCQESK